MFKKTIFSILILISALPVLGQKVALVMSGGGAKGIAHAGVLEVLEENNIPIDYIVGTSMGSIIGAFYAAGYSADSIAKLATSRDMKNWVNGVIEEKYQSGYLTGPPDPSWVTFKLTIDSAFHASIDLTLDRDYVLNINLAERLAEATHIAKGDFDQLLVPYRSKASEIFTEKEVLLDSGILYEATRSSMAVPIFYRAVRVNGQLLFDGGVYDNFPVNVAREEFNPDIIIGANVGSKKLNKYPYDNDESLIAESVLMFMLNKSDLSDLLDSDILIDIPVQEYSPLDFENAVKIYALGKKAALEKIPEIKAKIARQQTAKELKERRSTFLKNSKKIHFDTIAIEGFSGSQSDYIHKMFPNKRPLSMEDIKSSYFQLISDNYFLDIFPTYSFSDRNKFILRGNPHPRLRARIGGSLTSRSVSNMFLGFDYKRLRQSMNHYTANLFAGQFYRSFMLRAAYTLPGRRQFTIQPKYVYNNWDYINSEDLVFNDDELNVLERYDHKFNLNFNLALNQKYGFTWSNSYYIHNDEFGNLPSYNTADSFDRLRLQGVHSQMAILHNSLNYPQYANKGKFFNFQMNYFFTRENYTPGSTSGIANRYSESHHWYRVKVTLERFNKLGKKFRLGYLLEGVYSNQPVFGTSTSTYNTLPGFFPLQDSKTMILRNFRSRKYLAVGLKNIWIPKKDFEIRLEGFAFQSMETLVGGSDTRPIYETADFDTRFAGTFGMVYHSLIGPIGISLNYYDDPRLRWGGFLHLGYLLFNNQALE